MLQATGSMNDSECCVLVEIYVLWSEKSHNNNTNNLINIKTLIQEMTKRPKTHSELPLLVSVRLVLLFTEGGVVLTELVTGRFSGPEASRRSAHKPLGVFLTTRAERVSSGGAAKYNSYPFWLWLHSTCKHTYTHSHSRRYAIENEFEYMLIINHFKQQVKLFLNLLTSPLSFITP